MKIILSGDEIIPALEEFRSYHDPDNALSIQEIISNPDTNKHFILPLLKVITTILFNKQPTAVLEQLLGLIDDSSEEELLSDIIESISVLSESCDILLILK